MVVALEPNLEFTIYIRLANSRRTHLDLRAATAAWPAAPGKYLRWGLNLRSEISCVLFALSVVGLGVVVVVLLHLGPVSENAEPRALTISRGMSSKAIAKHLVGKRLIRNALMFQLVTRFAGSSRDLKAGTYQLSEAMTLTQIRIQLETGRVIAHRFVIPEGFTLSQIGKLWESEGFGLAETLWLAASSAEWASEYDIEGGMLEGYLFPDTYQLAAESPPEKLIRMMLDMFDRTWTDQLSEEARALQLTRHGVITLASIIEKEAKHATERPLISSVFHNRLRRGWRLEADPTILYALGNSKHRLTPADLQVDSPHNTYLHRGLPPGPICNPGIDSILAALRPTPSPYFFFVAVGNGTHHFSTTLHEHRKMIDKLKMTPKD